MHRALIACLYLVLIEDCIVWRLFSWCEMYIFCREFNFTDRWRFYTTRIYGCVHACVKVQVQGHGPGLYALFPFRLGPPNWSWNVHFWLIQHLFFAIKEVSVFTILHDEMSPPSPISMHSMTAEIASCVFMIRCHYYYAFLIVYYV